MSESEQLLFSSLHCKDNCKEVIYFLLIELEYKIAILINQLKRKKGLTTV